MYIHVLGSAAGGGLPQWNCGCDNCRDVRAGSPAIQARTQESVAVSADGESWFLINASPEIRQQIESFPALWPRSARHSPIAALLLTSGDLDHCLGLFSLRESHPLKVYATSAVKRGLAEGNVIYRTLDRFAEQVRWHLLAIGDEVPLTGIDGLPSGLTVSAIAAPGKAPLHLERVSTPSPEDNIGLRIRETRTGNVLAYLSSVAGTSPAVQTLLQEAACLFFDGTFWTSDELISQGLGQKRAEDMAHWPLSGPNGSVAMLEKLPASRRVLIHVNNTNPVLREDSTQRRELVSAGIELAYDGMELTV